MRLMVICMAAILAIGFLLGGRLRNLADLEIEWPWLALVGLALQFVTGPGRPSRSLPVPVVRPA